MKIIPKDVQPSHDQIYNSPASASNLFPFLLKKWENFSFSWQLALCFFFMTLPLWFFLSSCILMLSLCLSPSPLDGFHMPEIIPSQHVSHHDTHIKL